MLQTVSGTAEKAPGRAGRFLIPEIERLQSQRISMLTETMGDGFKALDAKFVSLEKEIMSGINELDKRIDVIERVATMEKKVRDLRERQVKA